MQYRSIYIGFFRYPLWTQRPPFQGIFCLMSIRIYIISGLGYIIDCSYSYYINLVIFIVEILLSFQTTIYSMLCLVHDSFLFYFSGLATFLDEVFSYFWVWKTFVLYTYVLHYLFCWKFRCYQSYTDQTFKEISMFSSGPRTGFHQNS